MNNKIIGIHLFVLVFFFDLHAHAQAEKNAVISVTGVVCDAQSREALSFASIQLVSEGGTSYGIISDSNGRFHLAGIHAGIYQIIISYLGYDRLKQKIELPVKKTLSFLLHSSTTSLNEVVITASESKGITSSSKIDRTAMEHLQPTSFTDLLELLPGGKSIDPKMGVANLISLREAGTTGEAISSLGVAFMIDGVPINTDGNLQYVPGESSDKVSVSKGVDMRMISTDNIESVEVIRGIPSVEYGNLTSGLVKIRRKNVETPLQARFKSDQYSKLFSMGKGFELSGGKYILNADISYLDSKVDPRNKLENYKRISTSARLHRVGETSVLRYKWDANADYTGSFDNSKSDPDISLEGDVYDSSYGKFNMGAALAIDFLQSNFIRKLEVTASVNQEFNKLKRIKTISIDRPTAVPNSMETGESDGEYLPYTYVANMLVDGKPMGAYTQLAVTTSSFQWLAALHTFRIGSQWTYNKNFGNGQIYDITRPLNYASSTRPRNYKDIPSTGQIAFYAEDAFTFAIGRHQLDVVGGVRSFSLLNLSDAYKMHGAIYVDPRINMKWTLPTMSNGWKFDVSAGLGWHTKAPTVDQLYPDAYYQDIVQLNYYHNNAAYRRINMMTYKWDNTNYNIEPARNRKWEVRLGASYQGNEFSVTYFEESMNNAFRSISYYKTLKYKNYDATSIDTSTLTGPPALENMTYMQDTLLDTYSMVGNGTRIHKQGIEFQFSLKRIEFLKTKITINGAWFRTIYSNSMPFYKSSSILFNGEQLQYVGLYNWEDGYEKQMFNTNFMFNTYIRKLGLILSTNAQCTWLTSSQPLWNDGTPTSYIDKSGAEHVFTEADRTDSELQHLVETYSSAYFNNKTIPFAMDLNLKATKEFGKNIQLSLFVNRILTIYPDYHSGTQLVRRQASPYFGMEMNFKF
ncbi:TonB-dependent receptor [uncultured Bacteroides sp.]|uniref:TonB-dependent receptor n=1 Tax=uncultured Bacteroides sp. TaxID=162156 RepID=UPI002AA745AF|nr:TonB-dependent receptor [uncultured Bacteroides sp.]